MGKLKAKGRKIGRNKNSALRYKNERRQEKSKAKKLRKRLINHPNDKPALKALEALNV
jgi:hypothetical protein